MSERLDEQAAAYRNASPPVLLQQLNECWTRVRTFERAVVDRDKSIDKLSRSIEAREQVIARLRKRLSYSRAKIAFAYAIIGGAVAEGVKVIILHWLTK